MAVKCKQVCKLDYSAAIAEAVGDAAARLAGSIRHWCQAMKRGIWKSNDEIMRELGLNRYQFEQARARIATRIRSGDSKAELQRVRLDDGAWAPISRMILYWKDRQNRMWYWVNEELFAHYAGVQFLQTIGNADAKHKVLQTTGNADAKHKVLQTTNQLSTQEQSNEYSFSFASEEREELQDSDQIAFEHVARLCGLPGDVRLKRREGDRWIVHGGPAVLTQIRPLMVQAKRDFGVQVEYHGAAHG